MKPIKSLDNLIKIYKAEGCDSDVYLKAKEQHIHLYGDRCLEELKLETHTLRTHPEILEDYIKAYNNKTSTDDKEKIITNKDPWFVKKAKIGIGNREISRMNRSRIFGMARDIFRKIGAVFYEEGLIMCVDDIFYITIEEITDHLICPKNLAEIITDRKREIGIFYRLPEYSRLEFSGAIFNKLPLNINNEIMENKTNILQGIPASGGQVEGEVLVVDKPSLTLDTANKILVTKITDPGWVFLIQHAKGVISEKGSPLSHSAIVTRELKKPSIVGLKYATSLLKTGDYIKLDGFTGVVTIISK